MKCCPPLFAAILAFPLFLSSARAETANTMPDQPVSREQLPAGGWEAFTAPLEATVTTDAEIAIRQKGVIKS